MKKPKKSKAPFADRLDQIVEQFHTMLRRTSRMLSRLAIC